MICTHCQTPLPDGSRFCNTCGADLSDPGSSSRVPQTSSMDVLDRLQGALKGRYEVHDLLGRGGMGMVYLATDVALDRQVAIKVLPPEIAHDASFVKRFEQEARTAAKLDHPNIMPIYAVEGIGDLHFFVMKYITGRGLDEILESGPLPLDLAQRVLWEAACALGHAHQRGFVHRDIKPANIMVDESGRTVLTDFGISKAMQAATQFTATGQVIGTPHYMSPEQCKGGDLDGRSDQYSLGIVGYRMLSGRLPFEEDSVHTVLYKHIFEMPPPLSELRGDLPPFLVTAIQRAINKAPDDRFPTMEAFATAVWPEHPVSSAGPSGIARRPSASSVEAATQITPQPEDRKRSKSRWPAVLGTLVLLGGAGAGGMWYLNSQTAAPTGGEVGEAGGAGGAAATATGPETPPAVVPPAETTRVAAAPDTTPARPRGRTQRPTTRRDPPPARTPPPAPSVGYLSVDADPFGTVYIDGREIGDTPLARHELSPGRHIVEVRREGYRTAVDTVMITTDNATLLRKRLIREP